MLCTQPGGMYWRKHVPLADEATLLRWAMDGWAHCKHTVNLDYGHYRAITLREARRRGLVEKFRALGVPF